MGPCVHGKCYRCSLRENANVMRAGMPSLNQKCASPGVFFLRSERKYLLSLIGSYGLRYHRDRSRVNISSLLSSGFHGNSTRDQLAVQWPNIYSRIKLTCSHTITDLWFSFQGWQSIGRHPQQHCSSRATKKTHTLAPVKYLIDSMPGGPILYLASTNEHVPEIERRIRVVK
jgi:hypothetical protein